MEIKFKACITVIDGLYHTIIYEFLEKTNSLSYAITGLGHGIYAGSDPHI